MAYQFVTTEVKDRIAYITITREKALNALNVEVIGEIRAAFTDMLKTDAGRVIFTGAGRSFIAGADIAEMSGLPGQAGRDYTKVGMDLMDFIEAYRLPVIAAVNGFALGGGCEFAMACDVRIASTKAKFGQPEVNLGIVPGFGGTQRLPRLVGKGMAKYMIMTGEMIDAEEAYRIGLVQKLVEPEKLMEEAKRVADLILGKAPIAIRLAKCAINVAQNTDLASGVAYELEAYQTTFNSFDRVEGMTAFVGKRPAKFQNK
jgi:enoyl-CoA hydratase